MDLQSSRILVTGATGFIGGHLIRELLNQRAYLRCTYRTDKPSDQSKGIEWVRMVDPANTSEWDLTMEGIDYVIHLAALAHQVGNTTLTIEDYRKANTELTKTIGEAALRNEVKRLLFVSSVSATGTPNSAEYIDDFTDPDPDTPYGISKLDAENSLEKIFRDSTKSDWVALRPCLVYGPGNPGNMDRISRLARLAIPLPIRSIKNSRSFIYIGNLIDAMTTSLDAENLSKKSYHISDNETTSTPELASLIAAAQGVHLTLLPAPLPLLRIAAKAGDILRIIAKKSIGLDSYSLDKLKSSLRVGSGRFQKHAGWTPPFTLREGIKHTFQNR